MINLSSTLKTVITGLMFLLLLSISHYVNATEDIGEKHVDTARKWLIVNFWAEWCKPCREEIPELNRLTAMLASDEIEVLGINHDGIQGAELDQAVKRLDIHFPQMNARQQELISFKIPAALPATYIVSPTGEVKASLIGKQSLKDILTAMEHVNPQFIMSELVINEQRVTP